MLHRGCYLPVPGLQKEEKPSYQDFYGFPGKDQVCWIPSNKSTGEILAFTAPKLKMVVNISMLATPHNSLTKYAVKAAINHRLMAESNISPSCLSEQVDLLIEGKFETEEQKAADSQDFFTEIANKS